MDHDRVGCTAGRGHGVIMGRRTHEALAGFPDEARDESWDRMIQLTRCSPLPCSRRTGPTRRSADGILSMRSGG
jgi:hypothetical protein